MPKFPLHDGKPAHWRSVTAHEFTSTPGARSSKRLLEVIQQFKVEREARYLRTPADTFCNIFAVDVIEAMGIVAPRHWVDPRSGIPTPVGTGHELSANKLHAWFEQFGPSFGWARASLAVCREFANAGKVAIPVWRNPDPKRSGHVVVGRPDPSASFYVAQAGARNSERLLFSQAFPGIPESAIALWVHE